jgi:hypothetical protein
LAGIWESHWGYLLTNNMAPVLLGEFGTRYQTDIDRKWFQTIANYIGSRGMDFTFWSWNPNSGDTGGILQDDWRTVNADKQAILQPLLAPLIGTGPAPVPLPPATPAGLTAAPGNQRITLSWNVSSGAASYNVYRSSTPNGQGSVAYRTGVTLTNLVDTGLTNGVAYYYRVTAVNSAGESAFSGEVSAIPSAGSPPVTPSGLSATAGDNQIAVRWSAANSATSYNLYRALAAGGQGAAPYRTGLTGTAFTDSGLTNGTNYFYRLTALNAAGESAPSVEVSARPTAAPAGNVTASGRVASGANPWWGQVDVLLNNSAPVNALTIEIAVQRTPGVGFSGYYNTYPGNFLSMSYTQTSSAVVYTYRLNPGQILPAGNNWVVAAQYDGNGTLHPTSGDTYSVNVTSGGVTRTFAGTF